MNIHVRLAEPFWRAVGQRDIEVTMNLASRADDLLAALRDRYPALAAEFDQSPPHIFIGDVESAHDSLLPDGARVHLVWPIAGG